MFLTVINENFIKAQLDSNLDEQDIGMFDYIKSFIGLHSKGNREKNQNNGQKITAKFDEILFRYKKVNYIPNEFIITEKKLGNTELKSQHSF